jgi:hypothetical protein
MYDMIPLIEAARHAEGCELSINEDIPLPLTLPAVVHKQAILPSAGGLITADKGMMLHA